MIYLDSVAKRKSAAEQAIKLRDSCVKFLNSEAIKSKYPGLAEKSLVLPWLDFFSVIFVDRYERFRLLKESRKEQVKIFSVENWVDFMFSLNDKEFNSAIRTQIKMIESLHANEDFDYEIKISENSKVDKKKLKSKIWYYLCILKLNISFLIHGHDVVVTHSSRFGKVNIIWNWFLTFFKVCDSTAIFDDIQRVEAAYDYRLRLNLIKCLGSSEKSICQVFNSLVLLNLPISYLEGHNHLVLISKPFLKFRPKIIFTTTGIYYSESFKVLVGEWRKCGAKLIVQQHGGGPYGKVYCDNYLNLERDLSDVYLSWGRLIEGKISHNCKKIASIRLSETLLRIKRKKTGSNFQKKYAYICGVYSTNQCESFVTSPINKMNHQEGQFKFAKSCTMAIKNNMFVKPYSYDPFNDFGNNVAHFVDNGFTLWYSKVEHVFHAVELLIFDYDSTLFAEAIVCDKPSIIFLHGLEDFPWNEIGEIYINTLSESGLLFTTVDSLTEFLTEVNVENWWNSEKVFEAREFLKENFYQASPTIMKDFRTFLKSELS